MGAGLIAAARRRSAAGNTGPDFANVVLLNGFEGTNGSTTITDESSQTGRGGTCLGNAQISTAQSKFGSSSLLSDGSGDAVAFNFYVLDSTNSSGAIGSGWDFQLEAWIRFASGANLSTQHAIITHYNATSNRRCFIFWYNGVTGTLEFLYSSAGTSPLSTALSTAWSPSASTWYHVAYSRVSGVSRIFVNGTKLAQSTANNFTGFSSNTDFRIGGLESGGSIVNSFNGNFDEVRVAVYQGGGGSGKLYTADFTAPTAAFPRS